MKKLSFKAIAAGIGLIWGETLLFYVSIVLLANHLPDRLFNMMQTLTMLTIISLMFFLTGGFFTARIARQAIYLHALFVWGLACAFSLLFYAVFPNPNIPAYYVFFSLLYKCGATFAGAYIYAHTLQPRQG